MSNPALQSHLRHPLTRLLGNSGNIRVLRALLAYGAPLSTVQVARDAGLTRQGATLVLSNLVSQGVVTVFGPARSQLFSITPAHPFAAALQTIFEQEQKHWDDLQHALHDVLQAIPDVRSAWLYGSVARAQDEPHSDIDVAVVIDGPGTDIAAKVREALQIVEDRMLVRFSVVALTPAEVARLTPEDAWWAEMARDAKVIKGAGPMQEALVCSRAKQPA